MAAPITHVVLSQKLFESGYKELDCGDFLLGTSFPDIRYIAPIERNITHKAVKNIQEIKESENAWEAGMKYHMLVDEKREKYVEKNIYPFLELPEKITSLKFVEDIVLYDRMNQKKEILKLFQESIDSIIAEQNTLGVPKSFIKQRYTILESYFFEGPTSLGINKFLEKLNLSVNRKKTIIESIDIIKKDERIVNKIKNMYVVWDTIIR